MVTITLDRVAAVAGIKPQLLRDWVNDKVPGIVPAVRGGKCRYHRFSVTQVVGIVCAVELQRSERGCALSYVARVVEALGSVKEQWLEAQFKTGKTHLMAVAGGKPMLSANRYGDWVDVQSAYKAVKQLVEVTNRQLVEVNS